MADTQWLGHANHMPPNYERISEAEFWRTFAGGYIWDSVQAKYITAGAAGHPMRYKHMTLFCYHDDTAIGYVHRIEGALPAKPKTFFRACRCKHEFKSRNVGRGLTEYTCTKCPYGYTVDSSG